MTLFRVIALGLLIWIGYILLKSFMRKVRLQQGQSPALKRQGNSEKMVRCEECGAHIPKSKSHKAANKHYCPEHLPRD
jgi:uncharacterized protein